MDLIAYVLLLWSSCCVIFDSLMILSIFSRVFFFSVSVSTLDQGLRMPNRTVSNVLSPPHPEQAVSAPPTRQADTTFPLGRQSLVQIRVVRRQQLLKAQLFLPI